MKESSERVSQKTYKLYIFLMCSLSKRIRGEDPRYRPAEPRFAL